MARQLIAFDLDGTLADSKSPITDRMSELLGRLLDNYLVCVMSGGAFPQFEEQLLANLKVEPTKLTKLHLMPTCGTRYYKYDLKKQAWRKIYAEDFSASQKRTIMKALKQGIDALNLRPAKTWGPQIEDRGSQITFSALGQKAPVVAKEAWDPDNSKKDGLRDYLLELVPQFEVRTGGSTSVDITKLGIDKAYGMRKLMDMLKLKKRDIIFIGDRLQEGRNDYPVKAMGIDCIEIRHWQETALVVEAILMVGK